MLITTAKQASQVLEVKAVCLAWELNGRFVAREQRSLTQLMKRHDASAVMVVSDKGHRLVTLDGSVLFFHPSLAKIRITSLLNGAVDRLLSVAGVQHGDVVLDCTAGLGSDAIVFSFAVGELGHVTAIESESVPFVLTRDGLREYTSGIQQLDEAMRRITAVNADHLDYLRALPSASVDVVYFDPMFRQPAKTVALAPLRSVANSLPISVESIVEARRVAKKAIVLKEQQTSGEFERLGFQLISAKSNASVNYGVIRLDAHDANPVSDSDVALSPTWK